VLGVLLSLLAAASFGINNATVRRGVITGTVTQVVVTSMPLGLAMFALVAWATGQLGQIAQFPPSSLVSLACAGVLHFVFGRYCGYRSIQAMGANLAAPVQQWSLLVTLVLAVSFLEESLDLVKVLGIVLMVVGPAIIVGVQKKRAAAAPASSHAQKFRPRLAEGYLFGVLSCLCWGSSPILVRQGLRGFGLGPAIAGGVVAYGAATLAVAVILLLPLARRDAANMARANLVWFFWIGTTVCISQMFMYLAMAIAPVTIVQPLMRFSNVFATLFGWMLNRKHEVFEPSVILAIGISVVGALALSIDAGAIMNWIGAPPGVAAVFAWSWPGR
jgi:drug/metabolite transporter (DMT)-like permease